MPTTSVGSIIYGSDYNTVQALAVQILGTGTPFGPGTASPTFGYNQTLASAPVASGAIITATQWNALASDINKIYQHVYNTDYPGYAVVASGQLVTAANYNLLFNTMTSLVNARLTVHPAQLATTTAGTSVYSSTWGGGATGISNSGSITWASNAALTYFFNQGGAIRFQGVGPNLSGTTQDTEWRNALNSFSYTINRTEFSNLTGTLTQRYSQGGGGGNYSANFIRVSASVSGGTISWTIIYDDNRVAIGAAPDVVSAGAGFALYVSTATGAFSGTAYSSANITNVWTPGTYA